MAPTSDGRRTALALGHDAELYVSQQLIEAGWLVLAHNWRGAGGEIDIVVQRGGALRFVEVKARSPEDQLGIEAIDGRKQRRLIRAAKAFLAEYAQPFDEVCFMVALVETHGSKWAVSWIDDAFDG